MQIMNNSNATRLQTDWLIKQPVHNQGNALKKWTDEQLAGHYLLHCMT